MEAQQTTNQVTRSFRDLFKDPSQILGIVTNPGKNGIDFLKSLSNKDKQYLAFAAGAGLIIYGFILNRKDV
jgi:hypothetical protein